MGLLRAACTLIAAMAGGLASAATSTVVDLDVAGGRVRFLHVAPTTAASANVISISGGDGYLGIADDGSMDTVTSRCGPMTRNRIAIAERGVALALMDQPPSTEQVVAVAGWLRARAPFPVWISGGSAATAAVAYHAANVPSSIPAGALIFAPGRLTAAQMSAITRPALVVSHANDGDAFPTLVFNGLVNSVAKERVIVRGGTDTPPCGFHLFWGADAEFIEGVTAFIARNNAVAAGGESKHQALWYAAPAESEAGWGVNLAHQGDILFATWFTYDADGPMWLVMSNGARVGPRRYQGALYRTRGPAFDSQPFDPTRVTLTEVGSGTFDFASDDNGTFSYSVGGVAQTKAITRQLYSSPVARCAAGAPVEGNFQDLWWNPSESGWGVNLTHQGEILFATWFTYARDGKGQWLVMSNLARTGTGHRYVGDIYRTNGAPFNSYDPARLSVTRAGSATFEFSGASAGTFTYTLDGVTQSKAITRQVFSTPTACR